MGAAGPAMVPNMMEAFFGKDGMTMAFGIVGDHAVTLLGDVDSLAKRVVPFLRDGKRRPVPELEKIHSQLTLNPKFIFSCDLRRMFKGIVSPFAMVLGGMGMAPNIADGKPIHAWCAGGMQGTRYSMQVRLDFAGLAEMIRDM